MDIVTTLPEAVESAPEVRPALTRLGRNVDESAKSRAKAGGRRI
jgi:hypothetical protein